MPTEKKRRHRGPEKDRWRAARREASRCKRRCPDPQTYFAWYVEAGEGQKAGGGA